MSFLDRFFEDEFPERQNPANGIDANGPNTSEFAGDSSNSFDAVSDQELAAHLEVDQYDSFQLTNAVRPALDLKIKPEEGYRHEIYVDEETKGQVPVIMAAVSREKLFDLFIDLIEKLGPVVDVVLESSHARDTTGHIDLYRESIEMPILKSILFDYEDLLLNDGCTGIAVLNPNTPQEIQFEEHKLLIVYGSPLEHYEFQLEQAGVFEKQDVKFITEAEHVHSSSEEYATRFERLRADLGLDGSQTAPNYDDQTYLGGEDGFGDGDWDGSGDACGGLM